MAIPTVAPSPSKSQFKDALKDFRSFLMADRGMMPTTAKVYSRIIGKLLRKAGSLEPDIRYLREYVADARNSSASQSHVANICRAIEAYTTMLGSVVPFARGRKYKTSTVESLTEGEVAVILNACKNTRERAVISLLAYSGIRNDELCRLKVCDVGLSDQRLRIRNGKGGEGRSVKVSPRCVADVQEYLNKHPRMESDLLFVSEKRKFPFEGATVRRIVKRVVLRTGIKKKVYPHIFRHSLAVNMLSRGANIFAIKDILGHSEIHTTLLYLRSVDPRTASQYEMFCPSYS